MTVCSLWTVVYDYVCSLWTVVYDCSLWTVMYDCLFTVDLGCNVCEQAEQKKYHGGHKSYFGPYTKAVETHKKFQKKNNRSKLAFDDEKEIPVGCSQLSTPVCLQVGPGLGFIVVVVVVVALVMVVLLLLITALGESRSIVFVCVCVWYEP